MNKKITLFTLLILSLHTTYAQKAKEFKLTSPDGKIQLLVQSGEKLGWSVNLSGQPVITTSNISLKLQNGEVLGEKGSIASSKIEKVATKIDAINYKKDSIDDNYSQLIIQFKGEYGVQFRAYNDGVAYRFVTSRKDSLTIKSEETNFNFNNDYTAYVPYVNEAHDNDVFQTSFENSYTHKKLSELVKDTLVFAPILVELNNGVKAAITEADLEEYPGMFLQVGSQANSFRGVYAPYPTEEKIGGHNNLLSIVVKRADYIARTAGTRTFPWRTVIISDNDKALLNNDMVYKLAAPSRIKDVSWITPGKVAWDWWNAWNISGVDFKAGINTQTYKYYIDFAAEYKIENILLDEGWATQEDIMKIVPEIDLREIIEYGKSKNVGVWLWGGWRAMNNQMDLAVTTYAKMGIKGFKIDFMDRDDQKIVKFYYRFARKTAEQKLMVDYHGAFKPTGLQRTYPNVVNFEGVRGLENVKWANFDMPQYDCTIPYIRQLAGPLDYTPGAMRNANKENFRSINSSPMSQGTRCHQLALYVLFESPFEMLCDNPTIYKKEKECTQFIASIPTTFDKTVAIDGKVAEYAAVARKKDNVWYAGAIGNWDARDLTIDLSFLGKGNYQAEIFQDGINADRDAIDYKRVVQKASSTNKLAIHLSTGGGWAAKFVPVKE